MQATLGSVVCNLTTTLASPFGGLSGGHEAPAPGGGPSGDVLVDDAGNTIVTDTGDRIVFG